MEIPDKYKEIRKKAQEIDANLEAEFKAKHQKTGKILLQPLWMVVRNVDLIIKNEVEINELDNLIKIKQSEIEINELNKKIDSKKNEIETAKQNLKEYGIIIPDTDL